MKTVKFTAELVHLILSGEKTSTWRLFDDKNLSVDDNLEFVNKETGEVFGYATITTVWEKKMEEICDDDFDGHEKFSSKEEVFETYRKYYGDRVDGETVVKIIHFTFIQK